VYGSLKRGRANHHVLHTAQYVAASQTAPRFALRMIDGYPALVPGTLAISGELHRIAISALTALDEFEGENYVRREIELSGGERVLAYLARVPEGGEPYPSEEWPSSRERSD